MRLKANTSQRALMLAFMAGVGLWSAWPNRQFIAVVVLASIVAGLYLFRPGTPRG